MHRNILSEQYFKWLSVVKGFRKDNGILNLYSKTPCITSDPYAGNTLSIIFRQSFVSLQWSLTYRESTYIICRRGTLLNTKRVTNFTNRHIIPLKGAMDHQNLVESWPSDDLVLQVRSFILHELWKKLFVWQTKSFIANSE